MRDYEDDFGKHTTPETATKIRLIWDAIPSQIARENNKFIFSYVKQGARAKDLEDALTENYVYTQLKCMGIDSYFWRTKADAEIDFITDYEGILLPIEVKAADNTKAKSLHLFCNRYHPKIAIKTSLKNVGDNIYGDTRVWSLPLYVLFRIKEYIL